MAHKRLQVPADLLLCPQLSGTDKLVWMIARLLPPLTAQICAASGLHRATVFRSLQHLRAAGWDPAVAPAGPEPGGRTVEVPAALVTNPAISVRARLLYAGLLLIPGFRPPWGDFSYAEMAALMQSSRNTVARALSELIEAEWVSAERASRLERIRFELTFPGLVRGLAAHDEAQERLERGNFGGEALMREFLSLLIDSDQYDDDAVPGFLINPRTGAPLEFDRFYPPRVAFEFHGAQHDRPTKRFPRPVHVAQRERDLIILGLCQEKGVTLVVVRAEDLTLAAMRQKVGALLPLRDLAGYEIVIDYLEAESRNYRERTAHI